jgi:hypothetical protein
VGEIVGLWNSACDRECWRARQVDPSVANRKAKAGIAATIRARWNESANRQSLEYWRDTFARVTSSKVLTIGYKTWAGATLPWILKPTNLEKIDGGAYDKRDEHAAGAQTPRVGTTYRKNGSSICARVSGVQNGKVAVVYENGQGREHSEADFVANWAPAE